MTTRTHPANSQFRIGNNYTSGNPSNKFDAAPRSAKVEALIGSITLPARFWFQNGKELIQATFLQPVFLASLRFLL
jgi:hypothetical protein